MEIDKLKDRGEGRLARSRARQFNSWLQEYEDDAFAEAGAVITKEVRIRLLPNEPRMSDYPDLDPDIPDDRILATFIGFASSHPDSVMVARDTALIIKFKSRALKVVRLPIELQRPPEKDELELEHIRTKAELANLKHRRPEIAVRLIHGDESGRIVKATLNLVPRAPADELSARFEEEETRWNNIRALNRFGAGPFALISIPEAAIKEFLTAYREFLSKFSTITSLRSRHLRFWPVVGNTGTAVASKTEIELELPEGFVAQPKPRFTLPKPPKRPTRGMNLLGNVPDVAEILASRMSALPAGLQQGQPVIEESRIHYVLNDLLQHSERTLEPFDVLVPQDWASDAFRFGVTIRAVELAEEIETDLVVQTTVSRTHQPFEELEELLREAYGDREAD